MNVDSHHRLDVQARIFIGFEIGIFDCGDVFYPDNRSFRTPAQRNITYLIETFEFTDDADQVPVGDPVHFAGQQVQIIGTQGIGDFIGRNSISGQTRLVEFHEYLLLASSGHLNVGDTRHTFNAFLDRSVHDFSNLFGGARLARRRNRYDGNVTLFKLRDNGLFDFPGEFILNLGKFFPHLKRGKIHVRPGFKAQDHRRFPFLGNRQKLFEIGDRRDGFFDDLRDQLFHFGRRNTAAGHDDDADFAEGGVRVKFYGEF